MASPEPPVAFKDHCSIIDNNILYVYSPDAFQSLPLSQNATWTQEQNGVSVTGAVCVKGGLDGDSENPALYVVGGTTNSSVSNYSGIQRYSIRNKTWETIDPVSAVTSNRQNHGATYLNASSAILVYGGSQSGNTGLSTETFLMLMYPPYRVQAYSSTAPAVSKPFVLPWTDQEALMVGGGNGNQKVYTFHPDPGWTDLGVTLPNVPPDPSIGQVYVQRLLDGSRILQTYYTNESPNRVVRNVLADPGLVTAPYGETIGGSTGTTRFRRQLLSNYPTYNATNAPTEQRTSASLAAEDDLVAIVGGDANSTVSVFNTADNSWVDPKALFGDTQKPLTTSSSTHSPTSTPTASQTSAASSSASTPAAPVSSGDGQTNGLAILGGVLGGICGLAAILIIALLWLRSVKRRKAAEAAAKKRHDESPFQDDKEQGLVHGDGGPHKPLSQQAQPMGRSPVASTVISERDSLAIFGGKISEKSIAAEGTTQPGSKLNPNHGINNGSISGLFKSNNRTPLTISKPMRPDLGDYQERPSIELGKATPSDAPTLPPVAITSQQKTEQRKTDEGWAKYFQADQKVKPQQSQTSYTVPWEDDPRRSTSRSSTAKSGGGTGFWPGAGVPTSSNRSTKLPLRDSAGNILNQSTVATASPSLADGHENALKRNMSIARPAKAKISSADSISTDHTSDDDYEDDDLDAYSDNHISYHQQATWNPVGSTWSGPGQRPLRPPSVRVGANMFPPPSSHSDRTANTSTSGGSSIPTFPLPTATIGRADTTDHHTGTTIAERPSSEQHALYNPNAYARRSSNNVFHGGMPIQDYFGPPPGTASSQATSGKAHDSNDMSWLNLGTPAHVHTASPRTTASPRDPA